jgi:hypothetical protein
LSCSFRGFDYGIDVTLNHILVRRRRRIESGARLDIQAKSTTRATLTTAHVVYDMEVKTYEDLRDPEVNCPRILVLLVLPPDDADWLTLTEDQLLLRRCVYRHSLVGAPATTNTQTVRVHVPRGNVFSVEALQLIMDRIRQGENP